MDKKFNSLLCSLEQGVAQMVLNRADKHNAFDEVMINEMITALDDFATDDNCQLLIIKALGKNFSAGADLNWMRKQAQMDFQQNLTDANELANLMNKLDKFPKPTIILVQGAAFGGALGLICASDIAIADTSASFCLSEVKLGLIPAVISPYVVRAMGQRTARRYMLTAERFDAKQALALNVIHEINTDLDTAAQPFIDAFRSNSPQAMSWVKSLLFRLEDGAIDQHTLAYTSEQIAKIRVSDEAREGLNAFFEKRRPNWLK